MEVLTRILYLNPLQKELKNVPPDSNNKSKTLNILELCVTLTPTSEVVKSKNDELFWTFPNSHPHSHPYPGLEAKSLNLTYWFLLLITGNYWEFLIKNFLFQHPAFALRSRAGDVYPVEKRDFLDGIYFYPR